MQGIFISFEGVDGVGKTTQVERLRAYVEAQGRECVVTREPGGTVLGVAIRELLLGGVEGSDADIAPRAEALLILTLCNRMHDCSMMKIAWSPRETISNVVRDRRFLTWQRRNRNASA